MPSSIRISALSSTPAGDRGTEHVERKGIGHPDTICDSIMEAVSVALCREYLDVCGHILHHNVDKGLLVAGESSPRPGGGTLLAPMKLIFSDRATTAMNGKAIPIGELAVGAAKSWIRQHLRFVDPDKHLVYQNEIRPGSPELVDIFPRGLLTANDTSAAVGYAPLTETERLVLEAERTLNSEPFKQRFPEVGEDVKVMALREGRRVSITVAAAFVDRLIPDQRTYFGRKDALQLALHKHLSSQLSALDSIDLSINTLDDPNRGNSGMYLTVLGTSAEGADSGQVGRGNRVNGLISLNRPMSLEAAAGKNPVSHVGKIYNLLSHKIANRIYASTDGIQEVSVWLCSQIGRPLAEPWSTAVEIIPSANATLADLEPNIRRIIDEELNCLPVFIERMIRGELSVV